MMFLLSKVGTLTIEIATTNKPPDKITCQDSYWEYSHVGFQICGNMFCCWSRKPLVPGMICFNTKIDNSD